MLISTLEAYFQGKKELFGGLAMEGLEKEWKQYPILHLDLNARKYDSEESLDQELDKHLEQWEKLYGSDYSDRAPEERFYHIIRMAYEHTGERVVILVDEYDKPMLQTINNPELQDKYRNTLKPFYGVMKSMDGYIKFALLTGVTKFGKVSVFSDLNNLEDISWDRNYFDICGISEQELPDNFSDDIQALADANGQTFTQACEQLKADYDGYHFYPYSPGIYNPFSLLNTFKKRQYGRYWFETGTPTYLVELLKQHKYDLYKMAHEKTTSDVLDSIDASSTNPIPVIYQSGYLTIKGFIPEPRIYELGFPNREVEEGFMKFLLPYYTPLQETEGGCSGNFLLADLFGVDFTGEFTDTVSYLRTEEGLTACLNDRCPLARVRDAELLGTVTLPDYPANDPERYASIHSNPPGVDTDFAGLTLHRFGRGQCVYLYGTLLRHRNASQREFGERLFRRFVPGALRSNLPPSAEVTLLRAENGSLVVAVVNDQEDPPNIPLFDVEIEIPCAPVKSVRRVSDGAAVPVTMRNGGLLLTLERLDDVEMFEIIHQ